MLILAQDNLRSKNLILTLPVAYLGGLGLNAWLMEQTYETGIDPLSPDNPIILGACPLVATGTPGAAKIIATTYFPLNGTISESVGSMRFALNLKGASRYSKNRILGVYKRMSSVTRDHNLYI